MLEELFTFLTLRRIHKTVSRLHKISFMLTPKRSENAAAEPFGPPVMASRCRKMRAEQQTIVSV